MQERPPTIHVVTIPFSDLKVTFSYVEYYHLERECVALPMFLITCSLTAMVGGLVQLLDRDLGDKIEDARVSMGSASSPFVDVCSNRCEIGT